MVTLLPPLSVAGQCRQYVEALPEPTAELCGRDGVIYAVGFETAYIVYRGVFDYTRNRGTWSMLYSHSEG